MVENVRRLFRRCHLFLFAGAVALLATLAIAQTTVGTGSIVGTVTDPSGAVVSGAKVTITNTATGQIIDQTTNASGAFNSGAVSPGTYKVAVSNKGFSTTSTTVNVQVGNTATANIKVQVGQESQTIEVQAATLAVNTEQATVQGVLNSNQIENLPVNGRNFLDLAQLEPGVQIQDGQNFDPTKAGYSSISFGGRFGRTARINVDGVDVSDETVGTTTADIPASAIDEFQLSQSSLDLSNDLTSSGAVNVTTKSGTNAFHGEAFEFLRDHTFDANVPGGTDNPFQRHQFGGKIGGPIVKNKAFFFLDGERTKQDSFAAVLVDQGGPLQGFSGGFSQPFRETNLLGRLDYDLGHGAKAFYRYSYFANLLAATFGLGYQVYDNKDYTRNHVAGIDLTTGNFTHSIRFSYLKFQNLIVDATTGNQSLPLCCTGLDIEIKPTFFTGPNHLAPQSTPQSNRQIKYDGSKSFGRHILRYGASYNRIQGGGFAKFDSLAPRLRTNEGAAEIAFANTNPFGPGGASNPLNFPVERFTPGNGLGFSTELPALGFPAGGLGPDNRVGLYIGDSWKIRRNFTLNAGLRWDRDTGRTDSDLPAIPEINAILPGLGNPVRQPNRNFAPQLGIAWDPMSNGKTVIRAGIGLFYENVIYNNVLFDRPLRLKTGAFLQFPDACNSSGTPQIVPVTGGSITPGPGTCGPNVAIGNAASNLIAFQQLYQSLNPFDLKAPNPNYIGGFIDAGASFPLGLFAPNYQSPRSLQMNVGIQREIRPGMVLSADYLRNVTTHTLLGIDTNQAGDVRHFNAAAASAAITKTLGACGAASIDQAITSGTCPSGDPTDPTTHHATLDDFAGNGLASPFDFGGSCVAAIGAPCAFGGINQNLGQTFFLFPIGRAVYNALQMKLSQNVANPVRGIKALNFQIAYSLSRYENSGGAAVTGTAADSDQDFVIQAADNNRPNRFFGPNLLDRTHQISFGGYVNVPFGFTLSIASHFYSPLSSSLLMPTPGGSGEVLKTDFTGDGFTQDPLPGTNLGNFDRGISASQLNGFLNKYNNTVANQPTPAGQALVAAGLMTVPQLQALGGVAPTFVADPSTQCGGAGQPVNCFPLAPSDQVDFPWLRAMDLKLAWRHTFKERLSIEPSIGFYNVGNFANFNLPPNTMTGLLQGGGGINGTGRAAQDTFRVGNGTGVYSLGAPRELEFGLRIVF
jgi:carboxypeptidase family protein